MTRYLILGLLRSGAPSHGYALMKGYRERTGITPPTGGFYRELGRLAQEGLVSTAKRAPDGDPRREPYEITETGKATFDEWLVSAPRSLNSCCDDELTDRAIFLVDLPPAGAREIVAEWKEDLWALSKTIERARRLAAHSGPATRSTRLLALLMSRRLRHIASDIEFLDQLVELNEASAPAEAQPAAALRGPAADPPRAPRAEEEALAVGATRASRGPAPKPGRPRG